MKINKNGLTLIEIMVVIALIALIALGTSRINFNPHIDRKNADMFSNSIYTNIENIRNDSFMGKGVGNTTTLEIPKKFTVSLKTGSGNDLVSAKYTLESEEEKEISDFFIDYKGDFSQIESIECKTLNDGTPISINSIDIEFSQDTIGFSKCSAIENDKYKILEIITAYKEFKNTIIINGLTGVMTKN